jgi:hypothetical protein
MSYPNPRSIQDYNLTKSKALTAADGSVTTDDLDLGPNTKDHVVEGHVLSVYIPELSGTELASADTLVILVQHGDTAAPTTAFNPSLTKTITGDGNTIAAQTLYFKLPHDVNRYVNVKFTSAGTSGDMSDKTAIVKLLT